MLAVLNETLPATSADIERELEEAQRLAWRYTALLERDGAPELKTELLMQALYNTRQHEAFLKITLVSYRDVQQGGAFTQYSPAEQSRCRNLLIHSNLWSVILPQADLITCAKQVEALQTDLVSRMKVLKATVHAKTAVPTAQVFVRFSKCRLVCVCLTDTSIHFQSDHYISLFLSLISRP